MIYLDYAADTPTDERVLAEFCRASREYIANANSPHPLGEAAAARVTAATAQIARLMHAKEDEVIYTSGASESNNLAIRGVAEQYAAYGKHVIATCLEHASVSGPALWLQQNGWELDWLDVDSDGQIDCSQLEDLLRPDTVLVTVCAVDSELGTRQDIGRIARLLAGRPHCFLHVDATQAVGKIPVTFDGADLMTFTPHKFYGTLGCGVLLKRETVRLSPQILGGGSTTPYRSGTPPVPLIAATDTALALAVAEQAPRARHVAALNARLRAAFTRDPHVHINSPADAVPFILNISVAQGRGEAMRMALAERGICVASKTACCAVNTVSRPVFALTHDRRAAASTLRISLSHLTTDTEIDEFLAAFADCERRLFPDG